jgi:hypothetical protein
MSIVDPAPRRHFPSARLAPWVAVTVLGCALGPGCAHNTLGRTPDEIDLKNDGGDEVQSRIYRTYEVVYERGALRRPGADPATVAAEVHVPRVDDVSSPAWSDDAYNYLSGSDEAATILEHPAVAFDEFAHSGNGELVILGLGVGTGAIGGAISWFVPTTVRDGISAAESNQLALDIGAGLGAGAALGLVVAAAYTYIVPAVATPLAAPHYRAAARAFNDELDARINEGAPPAAEGHDEHEAPCDGTCPAAAGAEPCANADGKPCCCAGPKCDLAAGKCGCGDTCACAECPVHGAKAVAPVAPSTSSPAAAEAPRPVEPSPAAPK